MEAEKTTPEMVYTVKQTADIMHCGVNYVYTLIKTGQIKYMKLPGIRIRRSTLEAFIESCEGMDLSDPEHPVEIAR